MNKKLMALAVAGALAAPAAAMAQTGNVQIYGRVNAGLDNWQATGATAGTAADFKSRNRVFDSGSRLGVRGSEDLGGGMRAIFQIENGVNIDTGTGNGQSGAANPSTGTFASRDSYGGLAGGWGDVRFGRQSIFWVSGVIAQSGANYINQEIGWLNGASMGRVAGPAARTSNVMSYNSPTVSGFNGSLSYAPQSEAAAANAYTNAKIYGVTLRYNGMINGQFDYAVNQAATTGGADPLKITGIKLGIGYPYAPGAQISVVLIQDKNAHVAAGSTFVAVGDSPKQKSWNLNWEHLFGNVQALAMYGRLVKATGCTESAGAVAGVSGTTCDGSDANAFGVAGKYFMSKRSAVYVSLLKQNNGNNQISDISGGGYSSAGATTLPAGSAGADVRILAVGVHHNF